MKKRLSRILGFTLMELLISITILSVIVVLIMSALRISTNAWEKGEKKVESSQRLRAVMEMMICQIETIRTDTVYVSEDDTYYIKGDLNNLAFVSTGASGYDGETQAVHITYAVEKEDTWSRLLLTERKIPILPLLPENIQVQSEENSATLLPECYEVRFEYLKNLTDEEGAQWQEMWDPAVEEGTPLAVKIVIQEDETSSPVCAIVRIIRDPTKKVRYKGI